MSPSAAGSGSDPAAEPDLYLLTGATGFIGGRLAERLAGQGRRVRCLVRPGADTRTLLGLGLELAVGDLTDPASLLPALAGVNRVVHCAGMVSDWASAAEITAANTSGTRNLLAACASSPVERFVHLSTTDIYGHPGGGAVEESHDPSGFANWYAHTKLQAEAEVARAVAETGLEAVVLRPSTVYGPGSTDVVGEIARAIRRRQMLLIDRGRPVAGLLFVENLIDAIELALDQPGAPGRTFNLTDGLAVTWRRFTDDLAAGLGASPPRWSLPYPLAFGIGLALEQGYRLLRRGTGLTLPPLLSRQAVQVLGRDQDFSNEQARKVLGWEPRVAYEEGLRLTVDWLLEASQPR